MCLVVSRRRAPRGRKTRLLAGTAIAVVLLAVMIGSVALPASASAAGFSDVPASNPYYAAISALSSRGIISGFADGTFGPDKLVLRKQFAKMIVGAMGLTVTEHDWQDATRPFTDCGRDDPNSLYPHDYIAVAKAHNLTTGKTSTTFAPNANITRAQMVTMVVRAAQNSGIDLDPGGPRLRRRLQRTTRTPPTGRTSTWPTTTGCSRDCW